jgi:ribosome biogenesis GTPase / thiamine phosphate phosphatase
MKARELGRGSVVVGDRVALAGDVSGAAGSLARIVRVEQRTSALRRSADDTDPVERVLVANADQMVVVCSLASPPPGLRFADRCLVAAYDAGLTPVLVLSKADLATPTALRAVRSVYAPLAVRMISTRRPLPAVTLGRLRTVLAGRVSVLIGQSGVGKSTLMNALVPDAVRAVGAVNPITGRGRHTSSSAVAFRLPQAGRSRAGAASGAGAAGGSGAAGGAGPTGGAGAAGWLIDTPGLRGFGLGHISPDRVVEAFGDLAEGVADCPPGCEHLADSPGCALDSWARSRHVPRARLDSLRRLLTSRNSPD